MLPLAVKNAKFSKAIDTFAIPLGTQGLWECCFSQFFTYDKTEIFYTSFLVLLTEPVYKEGG